MFGWKYGPPAGIRLTRLGLLSSMAGLNDFTVQDVIQAPIHTPYYEISNTLTLYNSSIASDDQQLLQPWP